MISIFYFIESHRKLFVNSRIVVVQINSLFGPMSNCIPINRVSPVILTIFLKPIISNCTKMITTFTTEIFRRERNVKPSICGKCYMTRNSRFVERCLSPSTCPIMLTIFMLPSLCLEGRIIEVRKIPLRNRCVISKMNFDCVTWISSPKWWLLT